MTDERRTLRDLLRERHARGAAVVGGRLIPDGEGGLSYIRHEPPKPTEQPPQRQVIEGGRQ